MPLLGMMWYSLAIMQERAWEHEYRNSKLLTKANEPQSDVVRFVKYLRKEQNMGIDGSFMLDLGSGTGRNSYYFAELGARVLGIEISATAVQSRRSERQLRVSTRRLNIAKPTWQRPCHVPIRPWTSFSISRHRIHWMKEAEPHISRNASASCDQADFSSSRHFARMAIRMPRIFSRYLQARNMIRII